MIKTILLFLLRYIDVFIFIIFFILPIRLWARLPLGPCDQYIVKTYYTLCYSFENRLSFWSYHAIDRRHLNGSEKRKNNFKADSEVQNPVRPNDYKYSGYDRGHLVPAADMTFSAQAMSESFFMTNITPQHPTVNRGVITQIETTFRRWVGQYNQAEIISGVIVSSGPAKLSSGVSIPDRIYKIIYLTEKQKMAAFLLPNNESTKGRPLWDYSVSVKLLEQLTGYDYFSDLEDTLEAALESYSATDHDFNEQ